VAGSCEKDNGNLDSKMDGKFVDKLSVSDSQGILSSM
jgi:hypothetical protein